MKNMLAWVWFSGKKTVGIVANATKIDENGLPTEWQAYTGPCTDDFDEVDSIDFILSWGAKLSKHHAIAVFPAFAQIPYKVEEEKPVFHGSFSPLGERSAIVAEAVKESKQKTLESELDFLEKRWKFNHGKAFSDFSNMMISALLQSGISAGNIATITGIMTEEYKKTFSKGSIEKGNL